MQSPPIHESKPIPEIPDIDEEQNMLAIKVQKLPIALRRGVITCTQKLRYHCHIVSYYPITSFLGHLNTITIQKLWMGHITKKMLLRL